VLRKDFLKVRYAVEVGKCKCNDDQDTRERSHEVEVRTSGEWVNEF